MQVRRYFLVEIFIDAIDMKIIVDDGFASSDRKC